MSLRVCIYTAICGGYDDLKPQPKQSVPCDFICFTDDPDKVEVAPWKIVPLDQKNVETASPRMQAESAKVLPHKLFGDLGQQPAFDGMQPYHLTIWIDASIRILRPEFAEELIDRLSDYGMAAIAHPERDCIFDEAEASVLLVPDKFPGMLREQVAHYRAQGFPEHHGLLATGLIVRDMTSEVVRQIDEAWWAEILRWSLQNQLSLPYVMWNLNARCRVLDINLWRNHLFEVCPHRDSLGDLGSPHVRAQNSGGPFVAHEGGDNLAMYLDGSRQWILPTNNSNRAGKFTFGPSGGPFISIIGDWDGDGRDSPGLYEPETGTFFLRNECSNGPADHMFSFGPPGMLPVVGDWDGDGCDSVGIFFPETGYWALTNRHEPGAGDVEFHFGAPGSGMLPVAGDWNGRGRDGVGLYEPNRSSWFLSTELCSGGRVEQFDFGPRNGVPVVGDWNGDGIDEVGVFIPEQGQAFLARANRNASACWRMVLDPPGAVPIAGRWNTSR